MPSNHTTLSTSLGRNRVLQPEDSGAKFYISSYHYQIFLSVSGLLTKRTKTYCPIIQMPLMLPCFVMDDKSTESLGKVSFNRESVTVVLHMLSDNDPGVSCTNCMLTPFPHAIACLGPRRGKEDVMVLVLECTTFASHTVNFYLRIPLCLIIHKYFRTPLKGGKKFSYPMKMLQNILVPPLFHSATVPSIKNDWSLK